VIKPPTTPDDEAFKAGINEAGNLAFVAFTEEQPTTGQDAGAGCDSPSTQTPGTTQAGTARKPRRPLNSDLEPVLLTVDDVSKLLSCSTRSTYRLSDSGRMPRPLKLMGMVRWKAAEIQGWIADGYPDCRTDEQRATRPAQKPKKTTVAKRSANDKRPA